MEVWDQTLLCFRPGLELRALTYASETLQQHVYVQHRSISSVL